MPLRKIIHLLVSFILHFAVAVAIAPALRRPSLFRLSSGGVSFLFFVHSALHNNKMCGRVAHLSLILHVIATQCTEQGQYQCKMVVMTRFLPDSFAVFPLLHNLLFYSCVAFVSAFRCE